MVTSHWDVQNVVGFSLPRGSPALPNATGPPAAAWPPRATPAAHSSRRCPRRKTGRRRLTRRAGGVGRFPPGDNLLGPRERRGSRGRKWFPSFSEAFSSRTWDFFPCPRFGVSACMEGVFSGDGTLYVHDTVALWMEI